MRPTTKASRSDQGAARRAPPRAVSRAAGRCAARRHGARTIEEHRARELTGSCSTSIAAPPSPRGGRCTSARTMTRTSSLDDPECPRRARARSRRSRSRTSSRCVYTLHVPGAGDEAQRGDADATAHRHRGRRSAKLVFDEAARRVRLKCRPTKEPLPPRLSLEPGAPIGTDELVEALVPLRRQRIDGRRPPCRESEAAAARAAASAGGPRAADHRAGRPTARRLPTPSGRSTRATSFCRARPAPGKTLHRRAHDRRTCWRRASGSA